MSLRDEIAGELGIAYDAGQTDDGLEVHQIDRVINKVLDAVVEAGEKEKNEIKKIGGSEIANVAIDVIDDYIDAINNLRDES